MRQICAKTIHSRRPNLQHRHWCQLATSPPFDRSFHVMLSRLTSFASSSGSSKGIAHHRRGDSSSKRQPRPDHVDTPVMRLALNKVAKGDSCRVMSQMAKACVAECGDTSVTPSHLVTMADWSVTLYHVLSVEVLDGPQVLLANKMQREMCMKYACRPKMYHGMQFH